MPKPIGEGWRKCPSVTPSSSPFFYARRSPMNGNRQWFMRDRDSGQWEYHEETDLPQSQTWGYAPVVVIETPTI